MTWRILALALALALPCGALAQSADRLQGGDPGAKPVPDPTVLTTQQLFREVETLQESQKADILALRELLEARLDAIQSDVAALRTLMDEKFKGVALQFDERDVRDAQESIQSKTAIDAALQAQKEAVAEQNRSSAEAIAKSERDTTKQIDGLVALIQTSASSASDKIDDAKSRLTILESLKQGGSDALDGIGVAVGIGIALVGLAIGAFGIYMGTRRPEVVYVPAPNGQKAPA